MSPETGEKSIRKFKVLAPRLPQGPDARRIEDYFYQAKSTDLVLFPKSDNPLRFHTIDFFFGDETLLEKMWLKNGGEYLTDRDLINEIIQPSTRFLNWRKPEGGEQLEQEYFKLLGEAQRVAYITCHGNTYYDSDGQFWGLSGVESVYSADRIVGAAIREGYDLIIITACNPNGLSLKVETEHQPRPTILRFNVLNEINLDDQVCPITIVPATKGW